MYIKQGKGGHESQWELGGTLEGSDRGMIIKGEMVSLHYNIK